MLELLLDDKKGNVWDLSDIVTDLTWSTSRIGKASSLEFKYLRAAASDLSGLRVNNGDIVRCTADGKKIFYGYVFSYDGGNGNEVRVICYDQIRYLMNSDTYVLKNVTATDVIKRIASDFGLKTGKLANTEYVIPSILENGDQKLIDIICKALDLTLIHTKRNYFLYDDFGELTIQDIESTFPDFYLGSGSLLTGYSYQQSIDSNSYNRIKLYKENKDTGHREVYIEQDNANIAKWGLLQHYQNVNEEMNAAQIGEMLDTLIQLKNRETKSLKVEALGDFRLRAGSYISLVIPEREINQPFLIEECTHNFNGSGEHTMSLELKVV